MVLTKHEGVTFQNQTVYISGQAFVRCNFIGCTLVLRETVYYLEGCNFEKCNWHVDLVLMWGSPESIREVKSLVQLIEQAQQLAPETTMPAPAGGPSRLPPLNIPPLTAPAPAPTPPPPARSRSSKKNAD